MAELIEKPFGLWTRVDPRDHILDRGPDDPMEKGKFEGHGTAHCKVKRILPCAAAMRPLVKIL